MEKAPPSRLNAVTAIGATIAGLMTFDSFKLTPREQLRQKLGKAPEGKKWSISGIYWPAGPNCNVKPTRVRNPKIRAHVQMMHEKWLNARAARIQAAAEKAMAL